MTDENAILLVMGFRNILNHGILSKRLTGSKIDPGELLQIEAFDKLIEIAEKTVKSKKSRAKVNTFDASNMMPK